MTAKEAVKFATENKAEMVDFKFCDMLGTWQHFTTPMSEFEESIFEDGLGFDGSSIRGWKAIDASDMLVVPDAATIRVDPFMERPTLSLICDIEDPLTRERYDRDPRNIAKKGIEFLKSTGIADTSYFGPEPEFFIFDSVRFVTRQNMGYYEVDSREANWNTDDDGGQNLGYKVRSKEGYIPCAPTDQLQDIRTEMCQVMESVGMRIERQHHEVATAGQSEIAMRFASLIDMADNLMWYKYIVKNVARRHGLTATFMPKPLFGDNGSGMHCHQSLWKDGKPLFAGDKYGGMSQLALHYIGGILHHAPAICAITNPTMNSYHRLVPGFEAPVNLAYSSRNRSASVRIPTYSPSPKLKRIEVRFPDPACNGYLAFTTMMMAGLDGIERQLDPGAALDKDIYSLSKLELQDVPSVPGSLADALDALEKDHEFLLKGDVFSEEFIGTWIDHKRSKEVDAIRLRPHPHEFELYYDC